MKELKLSEKEIITQIKNGKSYLSVAKKYDTTEHQIKKICDEHGIKSGFCHVTEEQIINAIKKKKAVTANELMSDLKLSSFTSIQRRLRRLLMDNKINTVIIPTTKQMVFSEYTNKNIYFISKDDLKEWVSEKLPETMPRTLRKIITRRLHEVGLKIPLTDKIEYKGVSFPEPTYNKLKRKAKKLDMPLREMIIEKCLGEEAK